MSIWLEPLTTATSYGRQAMGGLVSLALGQGAKFALLVGSTLVLVRLLPPPDFGLVAMAATVTNFMVLFKDAGLTMATIQQTEVTHRQISTLFWLNVLVGLGLALVTAASAPVLAYAYGEPALTAMVCVLAVGFLLGSLGAQHDALLRRRLHFKQIAVAEALALGLGCGASIGMAYAGFGWWSLVAQKVVQMGAYTVFCWMLCNWKPGWFFRWKEVRGQFMFGAHVSAFNFVNYFSRNGDNILIGWYWGASLLGIYTKAYDLLLAPLAQLNGPLNNLMTPLLGRLRNQPERYRAAYLRVIMPANLVMLPVGAFMFVMPEAITATLLGEGWMQASPVIMWLGLAVATQMVGTSTGWLLLSQQRSADFARIGVGNSVLIMLSFVAGLKWGIEGVAAAYALAHVGIVQPWTYMRIGKKGPVKFADFYIPLRLALWCAGVVLPGLLGVKLLVGGQAPLVQFLAGGVASCLLMIPALLLVEEGRMFLRNNLTQAKQLLAKS